MNTIRTFFAVLILVIASLMPANASSREAGCYYSQTVSTPLTFSYKTGSISIAYSICFTDATFKNFVWQSTTTYNNVSWGDGFSINGSVNMDINFASGSLGSIEFSGGPLSYDINGTMYQVSFNQFTLDFNSAFIVTGTTGSLTINGTTFPASSAYWAYLFH